VMARGHHDVTHAGLLGQGDPLHGIELHGVKLRRELFVLRAAEVMRLHHPFASTQLTVNTPVNKQAKARLLEPCPRFEIFGRRLIAGLGSQRRGESQEHTSGRRRKTRPCPNAAHITRHGK